MVGISIFWLRAIVVLILWFKARGKLGSDYIYTEKEMEEVVSHHQYLIKELMGDVERIVKNGESDLRNTQTDYEKTILLLARSYENKLKKVEG